MKKERLIKILFVGMLAAGCTSNEKESGSEQGTPIDSSVIGRDTNAVDVRSGVEQSDEVKQTLPGRDTTLSDEPR